MALGIYLFDIYRSANIGIFLKTNNDYCLVPRGLAPTKCEKIASLLRLQTLPISVAGSRLLGPLAVMNNKGILLSRLAEDEELETLHSTTGLKVGRLLSRFTSVGNLIAANDHGAIISDVFGDKSAKTIESVLQVPTQRMRISSFVQIGAMVSPTNTGAVVYPSTSEAEINLIRKSLNVEPEPATVNGGVPFVSSGFVGNSKSILVGNQTRGGELVIISRAFSL